jgi:hypothetical protein
LDPAHTHTHVMPLQDTIPCPSQHPGSVHWFYMTKQLQSFLS